MLLTKRLPRPVRARSTLVRTRRLGPVVYRSEGTNAEGGAGPMRRFPRKHRNPGRVSIHRFSQKVLPKPARRCFEDTDTVNSLRDANVESDVRPKGGQPRNHRHHDNRNEWLVHPNELNQHWNINQQCFGTNPVAEHARRARYPAESRRGVGGHSCGTRLSIPVGVGRHFERCSATEYGSAVPVVLRSAPALPPVREPIFQIP